MSTQTYIAKTAYRNDEAPALYEQRPYYQGTLGSYRKAREIVAVESAIDTFEPDGSLLDCPCGNGRWFERLARRAKTIHARDVSEHMVAAAAARKIDGLNIYAETGDVEGIDLEDGAVDNVFSYALMKHLPLDLQYRAVSEFARVSRGNIAVSFAVWNPLSYSVWRMRSLRSGDPIWPGELPKIARHAKLSVQRVIKVGTPAGMEAMVLFGRE